MKLKSKITLRNLVKVGVFALIILDGFLLFHLIAIYTDWIKPVEESNEPYMQLAYPPQENGVRMYFSDNWTIRGLLCTIDLYLNYTGILAEGVPIKVYAIGVKFTDGLEITSAAIRFSGASDYVESGQVIATGSPLFNPKLLNSSELSEEDILVAGGVGNEQVGMVPQSLIPILKKPASQLGNIVYDAAGDYYPSLSLNFKNGSQVSAEYPYLNHRLHVIGADVLQQQEDSRKNNAMQFDGILLSAFTLSPLGGYVIKEITKKNKPSSTNQAQPNDSKPYYEIHRKKAKSKKQRRNKHQS